MNSRSELRIGIHVRSRYLNRPINICTVLRASDNSSGANVAGLLLTRRWQGQRLQLSPSLARSSVAASCAGLHPRMPWEGHRTWLSMRQHP